MLCRDRGFDPLSQAIRKRRQDRAEGGEIVLVPQSLRQPIEQDCVRLQNLGSERREQAAVI